MKWEYRIEPLIQKPLRGTINPTEAAHQMNELGSEGWELVTVHNSDDYNINAVFKRPILE